MKIDFYHVDAFEVANYAPIWTELTKMGVDAKLVAVSGPQNTASKNWFDFDKFLSYCLELKIPFFESVTKDADLGITTQNSYILNEYSKKLRLMYGPTPFPHSWTMQEKSTIGFDSILVHGPFHSEYYSRWISKDKIKIIGYPRYDDYFLGKLNKKEIQTKWEVDLVKPVLMFLPTWGDNTAFDQFFPKLLRLKSNFNVIIRPHHCTLRMEPNRMKLIHESGFKIMEDAFDLPEAIAGADIVLADVRSGSFYESIMCGLPTLGMLVNQKEDLDFLYTLGIDKVANFISNPNDLLEKLEITYSSGNLKKHLNNWSDQYVSFRDGTASKKAADAIINLLDRKKQFVKTLKKYNVKVSIVLPSYNHLDYLPFAIDGILSQTYKNFELIIVNDGSRDGTKEYLSTLQDPRIKVINRENGGLPSALNCGFEHAQGEFLTWTSADNYTAPCWLEKMVSALDNSSQEIGFVWTNFCYIDDKNNLTKIHKVSEINFEKLVVSNPGIASFLYRASLADIIEPYDLNLEGAEDWDFWIRLFEITKAIHVDETLYYYRFHENSMTHQIPQKVLQSAQTVIQKLITRHNNKLDLMLLYPALKDRKISIQDEWSGSVKFSSEILLSPYWPSGFKIKLIADLLNASFNYALFSNLIHLLLLLKEYNLIEEYTQNFIKFLKPEILQSIRSIGNQPIELSLKTFQYYQFNSNNIFSFQQNE